MIEVFKLNNYDVKSHLEKYRRGFIIPISRRERSVLYVTSAEKNIDHEKIADEFIYLSDEKLKNLILKMGFNEERDFNDAFNMIKRYQEKYKAKKEIYPSSRKDFLIYEEGAIAYDSSSNFGKFLIYRDSDNRFKIEPETERIVFNYSLNGWKIEPAPEDPQISNKEFFF